MLDVADPSGLFLTERRGRDSGSAVVVSMEGTRPLLVEAQALATTTAFGAPRITTNGVDRNRLLMLLAVLTKRVGLALANQDVYVNVAGGFTLDEPAVDLGVAVAVASSFTERRVTPDTVAAGRDWPGWRAAPGHANPCARARGGKARLRALHPASRRAWPGERIRRGRATEDRTAARWNCERSFRNRA